MAEDVPAASGTPTLAMAINQDQAPVDGPDWMYKRLKFRGRKTGIYYASPGFQLILVALVCFMCPGMFNALGGLGGSGQHDVQAADLGNTALYATFAVIGFFSGSMANRLGVKRTLTMGTLGYVVYAGSFLCYNHNQNTPFVIFGGCTVGFCAGLLWTAQGAIMMAYPAEANKGRSIALFWAIFNAGAVLGALVPLTTNLNALSGAKAVSDNTYIAFMVLMVMGTLLSLLVCDAQQVRREDGSHIILMKNPTWKSEIVGLWNTLSTDKYIVCLFPMFFVSNFFYTYQFNGVNQARFTVRADALNNLFYWFFQIVGAFGTGFLLDRLPLRRSTRAWCALLGLFIYTMVVWGGGQVFEKHDYKKPIDWNQKEYAGAFVLYISYGCYDATWQLCVYWFLGALSNSGRKTANYAGFYKGVQSAGAAIAWRMDSWGVSHNTQFYVTWSLLVAAIICAAPVIIWKVKDSVPMEDDLQDMDVTVTDIIPQDVTPNKDSGSTDTNTTAFDASHYRTETHHNDVEMNRLSSLDHDPVPASPSSVADHSYADDGDMIHLSPTLHGAFSNRLPNIDTQEVEDRLQWVFGHERTRVEPGRNRKPMHEYDTGDIISHVAPKHSGSRHSIEDGSIPRTSLDKDGKFTGVTMLRSREVQRAMDAKAHKSRPQSHFADDVDIRSAFRAVDI